MRTLVLLSCMAICLGLATAAPLSARSLITALLKRQAEEGAVAGKPEVTPPTEDEVKALVYLGYSIEWLVQKAEDPAAFIAYMDAEMANDAEKRQMGPGRQGGKGPRGGRGRGRDPKPKGKKDWEADFERAIMEHGIYNTVRFHIGFMANMLKHTPGILAKMAGVEGPEVPEEIMAILLGEEEDSSESGEDGAVEALERFLSRREAEEQGEGRKGKGPKGQGENRRPKKPCPEGEECPPPKKDDATAVVEALERFLSRRQEAEETEVEQDQDEGRKGKGPRGRGPAENRRPKKPCPEGEECPPPAENRRPKKPCPEGEECPPPPQSSSEEDETVEVEEVARMLAKRLAAVLKR